MGKFLEFLPILLCRGSTFSWAIVKSFENFCSNEMALLFELVTLHLTIGDVIMVILSLIFWPVKVSDGVRY